MKTEDQFKDNDNFLFQINQFSKGKPIKPKSFESLANFLAENINKPSVNLTRLFLRALETHPAYMYPNSRRRREVYLRSAAAYCLSEILNLGTYEIASLLNKDRSTIFFILRSFKENLKFNKMLFDYFRGYLSTLIIQLENQTGVDYEQIFLELTRAKGVDEVLNIVQEIRDTIKNQKN